LFKYAADRLPVTIFITLTIVDFLLYFLVQNIWIIVGYWLVMILVKANICAWNHHHQHIATFKQKSLNRILEFSYALHTGVTTNLWVLHHVLGHHANYLDQTKDESRWMRPSGQTMGELEYTLKVAATAYPRGLKVGKRFPKTRRAFIVFTLITFSAVVALTAFKPLPALLLFVLPMISGLLFTAWTTYDHHSGLNTNNHFEASRNKLNRFYNLATGNLGYHTAHHYKHGSHWSVLPELHETIKDKIPPHLISHSVL